MDEETSNVLSWMTRGIPEQDWVSFLQWALPQLRFRWRGFRNVRKQVIKRVRRRMGELNLTDLEAYRAHLAATPDEWIVLDRCCRISISRFRRDRAVFDLLRDEVLPRFTEGKDGVAIWCAGCASGEEPYSLALCWQLDVAQPDQESVLDILATDADASLLDRAREARYAAGTLKEIPRHWFDAFDRVDDMYVLREQHRGPVRFRQSDIRDEMPEGKFRLIACRNLAFTYFEEALQHRVLDSLARRLSPGGVLVLGNHERLPDGQGLFDVVRRGIPVFVRRSAPGG